MMKHAKRDYRDFLDRHAVTAGVIVGALLGIAILILLANIKIPV